MRKSVFAAYHMLLMTSGTSQTAQAGHQVLTLRGLQFFYLSVSRDHIAIHTVPHHCQATLAVCVQRLVGIPGAGGLPSCQDGALPS